MNKPSWKSRALLGLLSLTFAAPALAQTASDADIRIRKIESEVTGVVREICVEDSQPVEFGTVLFRVDPNG